MTFPESASGPAHQPLREALMAQAVGSLNVPVEHSSDDLELITATAGCGLAARAQEAGYDLAEIYTDVRGRTEQGFTRW